MKIVTGSRGTPHITSNDMQAFNQGIVSTGNAVLTVGQKFAATLTDANTVTIEDGDGVMQGVHFRILPGEVEDVSIANGTSGYNRIDLICARYTKDALSGHEDVALVVVEGTPSDSTPTAPDYNTGDILEGATVVDMPLYKVTLTGLTPALESVMPMVTGEKRTASLDDQVVAQGSVNNFTFFDAVGHGLYWLDASATRLPSGDWQMIVYAYTPSRAAGQQSFEVAKVSGNSVAHHFNGIVPFIADDTEVHIEIDNDASADQTFDIDLHLTKVL